jgi:hypothetical protein
MAIDIQLVETYGAYWISTRMNGRELERRGPYHNADAAEAMAARMTALCGGLFNQPVHAGAMPTQAVRQQRA